MSAALGYTVWAVLGAATLILWAASHTRSSGLARPVEVLRRLASGPVLRLLLVLAVAWTGWHLFAR
jgi:hypothetical protein